MGTMDKQRLMEYLRVVCSGEEALIACDEMGNTLKNQVNRLSIATDLPIKPVKGNYGGSRKMVDKPSLGNIVAGAVVGGIVAIIIGFATIPYAPDSEGQALVISGVICGMILPILPYFMKKSFADAEYEGAKARFDSAEESRYSREMKAYNQGMKVYRHMEEVRDATKAELNVAIEENQSKISTIKEDLRRLYAQNIIYLDFHDTVAAHQLLKYLEMGLCDGLEGPNGAYKYYLDELHAQQICGSIQELRRAMEEGMKAIIGNQRALIYEMQQVNENISRVNDTLERELSGIRSGIDAFRSEAQARGEELSRSLHSIDTNLDSLRKNLHASVNNDYVVLRETRVRQYLERPSA